MRSSILLTMAVHLSICSVGFSQTNENLTPDGRDVTDDGASNDDNGNGVPSEGEAACFVPLVESVGPRYLAITAQPPLGPELISFEVTSPNWPCMTKYVGSFTRCGGFDDRCDTDADCNACSQFGGPCLTEADCMTCAGSNNPCQSDADCGGPVCEVVQTCVLSGLTCLPGVALHEVDLDRDGFVDGVIATLVEGDVESALALTAEQWGTRFRRCSISMDPCTDDADCDVGQCDIAGQTCSQAANDCGNVCAIGQTQCDIDAQCLIPGDTCSRSQTCDPFETCDYGKLYVVGENVLPSEIDDDIIIPTTYTVRAICNLPTDTVDTTMWVWADADNNGRVNIRDAQLAILAFQGSFLNDIPPRTAFTVDLVSISPCRPTNVVNFRDVIQFILAFQGAKYNPDVLATSDDCGVPCP